MADGYVQGGRDLSLRLAYALSGLLFYAGWAAQREGGVVIDYTNTVQTPAQLLLPQCGFSQELNPACQLYLKLWLNDSASSADCSLCL